VKILGGLAVVDSGEMDWKLVGIKTTQMQSEKPTSLQTKN